MKRKQLGATGLNVSEICLGTMQFGWYMDEAASFSMMDYFIERGGNFLDTADMYSNWAPNNPGGVSEQIIGRWLKARKNRSALVIATKCRGRMWQGADGEGLSRSHILRACEDSLRRLGIDCIDVYQSHWDDDVVPQEETMAAFDALVQQGKVRNIGCSNFKAGRLRSAQKIAREKNSAPYRTIQPQYNLAFRAEYESEVRGACQETGVACIPYSPLGGGLLTGKFHQKEKPKTNRAEYITRYTSKKADEIVLKLLSLSKSLDVQPLQLALRWVMAQPTVVSPIIGASTNEQLKSILDSAELNLPEEILPELTQLSAGV